MISEAILRLEVGAKIYERGEDIFKKTAQNKITFMLLEDNLIAKTKVKDYDCKIDYSITTGNINNCSCTCLYYDNNHIKCKHIVGFALQINNSLKSTIRDFNILKKDEKTIAIKNHLDDLNKFDSKNLQKLKVQSVFELTSKIKNILEDNPELNDIEVQGEISTFTPNKSGHIYFSIKDKKSVLNCVMFKWAAEQLTFTPKTGDEIILEGDINVYEPRGNYQLNVKKIRKTGDGDLFKKYLELKNKLEKEGIFDIEHKKPIPKFPKTIGVISSPTGAVIEDIIKTVKRRFPKIKITLMPVRVQGKGAEKEIIEAIDYLENKQKPDTIIIARGGGSMEDLWCFNNESLVRRIFKSNTPIISAIGHETDFTLTEFASDVRASTPTAAAEIATPFLDEINVFLTQAKKRITNSLKNNIQNKKLHLAFMESTLISQFDLIITKNKNTLKSLGEKLNLLNAKTILNKGYSITMLDNKVIKDANLLKPNQKIKTILSNGEIISNIEKLN